MFITFDLGRLLRLEKMRRGVDEGELVFINIANVAKSVFCVGQAVLACRSREVEFFGAYLQDIVDYSIRLGFISPAQLSGLDEVEMLRVLGELGERLSWREHGERLLRATRTVTLFPEERRVYEGEFDRLRASSRDKHRLGELAEILYAESYPSIRWSFNWREYTLVGIPDGITNDFVYEFKSTGKLKNVPYRLREAMTQADLYGCFFHRPKKKVQVYCWATGRIEADEMLKVDLRNAINTLEAFRRVDKGETDAEPANPKLCKRCDFETCCPWK